MNNSVFGNNYTAFKKRYLKENSFGQVKQLINQEDLQTRIDSISFTASAEVLRGSLPEKIESTKETYLSGEAATLYEQMHENFYVELANEGHTETVLAQIILVQLLRLSQITSGFIGGATDEEGGKTEARRIKGSSKLDTLKELLEEAPTSDSHVIFCRFKEEIDMVKELVKSMGFSVGEISGRKKDALTSTSEMADVDVAIVQLQSGSSGISLVKANRVYYMNLAYSLLDHEQSLFRVHRPGQDKPVFINYLITPGSVDEKIMNALEQKKSITDMYIEEARRIQAADKDYDA